MSLFDSILKNISGSPDDVRNLAHKVGIDPAMAEKAIAALGQAHQMQGDTVELASAKTGLDTGTLGKIGMDAMLMAQNGIDHFGKAPIARISVCLLHGKVDDDVPWDQVRTALAEIGFTGWATAEVGGGDVKRLTQVREQMQKAFGV